ncbi:MAG: hypothetical protein QOF49_2403, partial [Chloroflexota bacterium]|nr:hypothetical protein [Chloroflexota bacterium]
MSLDRLAADIGVSVSYLSKIERESHVPSSWIMDSWERVIGLPWPGRPSVYAPAKSSPEAGQLDLGLARSESNSTWMEALLPSETLIDPGPPALYAWDLPQTISELSYLTHNFYRYYGKFPP